MIDKIKSYFGKIKQEIKDLHYEIRMATQRALYGYDDDLRDNLDEHIAYIISDVTSYMEDNTISFPNEKGMTLRKWKKILGNIRLGFASYLEMRSGMYEIKSKDFKILEKNFKEGLKLLSKHYHNLWD